MVRLVSPTFAVMFASELTNSGELDGDTPTPLSDLLIRERNKQVL